MTLAPLLRDLVARGHRGMALGLERVRAGAAALGDPQEGLEVVHVAGTNGKGSVSAMVERVAREAGSRTGLYTSPHLVRFAERIRIGGEPIDDAAFEAALGRVLRDAPGDLTFFETLTLAAFVAFREAEVGLAVLEVGLGGRLDATNLVRAPRATAVVTITEGEGGEHLEHAEHLGRDVATIAREKAGIFKAGSPAVLGALSDPARGAVLEAAAAAGAAPVWELGGGVFDARSRPVRLEGSRCELPDGTALSLRPALPGEHQLENAAVAAACARLARLGDVQAVERGIELASWPGRLERIRAGRCDVWLDCAHNVEGARALARALDAIDLGPRPTLVFGALADKPWRPMLRLLAPRFVRRVYTRPPGRASVSPDELAGEAAGEPIAIPEDALGAALSADGEPSAVVVTGSIYLVGRARASLLGLQTDPAIGL